MRDCLVDVASPWSLNGSSVPFLVAFLAPTSGARFWLVFFVFLFVFLCLSASNFF